MPERNARTAADIVGVDGRPLPAPSAVSEQIRRRRALYILLALFIAWVLCCVAFKIALDRGVLSAELGDWVRVTGSFVAWGAIPVAWLGLHKDFDTLGARILRKAGRTRIEIFLLVVLLVAGSLLLTVALRRERLELECEGDAPADPRWKDACDRRRLYRSSSSDPPPEGYDLVPLVGGGAALRPSSPYLCSTAHRGSAWTITFHWLKPKLLDRDPFLQLYKASSHVAVTLDPPRCSCSTNPCALPLAQCLDSSSLLTLTFTSDAPASHLSDLVDPVLHRSAASDSEEPILQ
jgi:hypothetical protein